MYWRMMKDLWQQRHSLRARVTVQQTLIFGLLSVFMAWSAFIVKLQHHVFLLLLIRPLSVLLAGVASWTVVGKTLAPLQQLSDAAKAISHADLSGAPARPR